MTKLIKALLVLLLSGTTAVIGSAGAASASGTPDPSKGGGTVHPAR